VNCAGQVSSRTKTNLSSPCFRTGLYGLVNGPSPAAPKLHTSKTPLSARQELLRFVSAAQATTAMGTILDC
jgi:hypothetical protein